MTQDIKALNASLLDDTHDGSMVDHSQEQEFTQRELPQGVAFARFIGYIEVGEQVTEFKGEKKVNKQVVLGWELHDIPSNPKGFTQEFTEGGVVTTKPTLFYTMPMNYSLNSKSKFLRYARALGIVEGSGEHMTSKLGSPYIIEVHHVESKKDNKRKFMAIETKDKLGIRPAVEVDITTGETKTYPVPEQQTPTQVYIYDKPRKDRWDSIFIEGYYEVEKADGSKEKVSKNRFQNMIMNSTTYVGSGTEAMLSGLTEKLTTEIAKAENPVVEATVEEPVKEVEDKDAELNKAMAEIGLG